jgi:hypothetical protein
MGGTSTGRAATRAAAIAANRCHFAAGAYGHAAEARKSAFCLRLAFGALGARARLAHWTHHLELVIAARANIFINRHMFPQLQFTGCDIYSQVCQTIRPPIMVVSTRMSEICSVGTVVGSPLSRTRSASLPGVRLPLMLSSNEARAPLMV